MFDHRAWNSEFLRNPGQNDAQKLNVRVTRTDGAVYRVIGVHHLTGGENKGNHNIFLEVLDEQGKRIMGSVIEWTWIGRHENEAAPPTAVDKPANEPGGSIPMFAGQTISVWVHGAKSDQVVNLTSSPNVADSEGNTRYHHSYYIVWQRNGVVTPPAPDPDPGDDVPVGDEAALRQRIADLEAVIAAIVPVLESGKARMAEAMQVTIDGVKAAMND